MSKNYSKLDFTIEPPTEKGLEGELSAVLTRLGASRSWTIAAPSFKVFNPPEGSEFLQRIGGTLFISSASPCEAANEEVALHEVSLVVDVLTQFSADFNVAIELELDGVHVGFLENGIQDELIQEGLLAEWRRAIDVAKFINPD